MKEAKPGPVDEKWRKIKGEKKTVSEPGFGKLLEGNNGWRG